MKKKFIISIIFVFILLIGFILYNRNISYAAPANIPEIIKVEKSTLEDNALVVSWNPNNDDDIDFSIEIYNKNTSTIKKFAGSKFYTSFAFKNQPSTDHYGFMIRACYKFSNCTKWSEIFDENSVYENQDNIDDNTNNDESIIETPDEEKDILLKKITLDSSNLSLNVGNSYEFLLNYYPENATNIRATSWSSNNTSVATISNGVVTAKKAGTAVITAKVNDKTATCKVIVIDKKVDLKLNKSQLVLKKGNKSTITATYNSKKKITWKSSNTKTATVSSKGVVTAKKGGNATISATVDGKKAICKVIVKAALKSIKLNKTKATLHYGKKLNLNVTYNPSDTTDNKKITWKSSNTKIATVSSKGVVTAKGHGTATITAKVGSKKVTCKITAETNQGKVLKIAENEYRKWKKLNNSQKCGRIKTYMKACGYNGLNQYCGGFVSYVTKTAGVMKGKGYCSANEWYNHPSKLSGGKRHSARSSYKPKPGDIMIMGTHSHVGIVKKVKGDKVYTIDGNNRGSACGYLGVYNNTVRTRSSIKGFVSYNK